MATFDPLWRAFQQARREPAGDLASSLRALPEVGRLPSAWATWTLIGLVRHRRRQLWVARVVASSLGANLKAIARRGALGHPAKITPRGLVPGLTEWEYAFHGRGCCLTHRGTGEAIDVDFFEPTAEFFDVSFYLHYLRSLRHPEPPEARLIALHPSFEPVRLAVGELRKGELLAALEGRERYPFRVAGPVLEQEDVIDAFCESWSIPGRRVWLAAVVGDWPAAHEAAVDAGDAPLIELTASRADQCRALRCRELLAHRTDAGRGGEALRALDDLDAEALGEQLSRALRGPIDGVTWQAVQIIRRRANPSWCPAIYELFRRLDPGEELPQPYLWAECQRFLLDHDYRAVEMRQSLPDAKGLAIAEAALLALEHDPGRALPLFRRALRSPIPMNRTKAAATLALIDRPWSRCELLAVLGETDDPETTADCRSALLECHDYEAQNAVLAWERENPNEPAPGPWITMNEVVLRNCPQRVRWQMEELHDRVMKVRDSEPGQ
jgi:hypothetical protein